MKVPKEMQSKKPLAIDLFSGCGGLTEGLKQAGFFVGGAVELCSKAAATYELNHPEVELFIGDITKIDARAIRKRLSLRKGELDLLAGCPPCQGFSRIKTKNGKYGDIDPRNSLVFQFKKYVDEFFPKCVMLENVPALSKHQYFSDLKAFLEGKGYSVIDAVHDAAEYGVPQRRKRLIMLASRISNVDWPMPSESRSSVRQTFSAITRSVLVEDDLHNMPQRRSEKVERIIRAIPKNGGSRTQLPDSLKLDCHMKMNGFFDVYGRMAWDDVSPTITGGCYNPSRGRFIHPEEDRAISLREAALLQGFPLRYKFLTSHGKESIAQMIGNALPPPLVLAHARPLYQLLVN